MHPCDAGTPGKYPWCNPYPGENSTKNGIDAPTNFEWGGLGSFLTSTFGLTIRPD